MNAAGASAAMSPAAANAVAEESATLSPAAATAAAGVSTTLSPAVAMTAWNGDEEAAGAVVYVRHISIVFVCTHDIHILVYVADG